MILPQRAQFFVEHAFFVAGLLGNAHLDTQVRISPPSSLEAEHPFLTQSEHLVRLCSGRNLHNDRLAVMATWLGNAFPPRPIPSALGIITDRPPRNTAAAEFKVPKSIPTVVIDLFLMSTPPIFDSQPG